VYLTHRSKWASATLVASVLIALVGTAAARAGNGVPQGMTAQEWRATQVSSAALNRTYHLGTQNDSRAATLRALRIRGEALNRTYHLGAFRSAGVTEQTLRALGIRGDALNQRYHLGSYAVVGARDGFKWVDAAVGAAAMFGVVLLVGGVVLATRRHRDAGEGTVAGAI
jgi:hypothetical protein